MRSRTMATAVAILTLLVGALMPAFALASTSGPYTRQIASAGTTSFRSTSEGTGELQWPEFPGAVDSGEAAGGGAAVDNPAAFVNRSHSQGKQARGAAVSGGQKAK